MSNEQSSPETDKLATALAKARPEMPHPVKNCRNPHFDNTYADQKAIMDAISPAMGKHGLSLTFQPDGEALTMHGYLRHSSGQWLRASLPLILGNRRDMQALGAAITYAKRYLTGALLSLHHDTDDDAESTMGGKRAEGPKGKPKRAPRKRAAKRDLPDRGAGIESGEDKPSPAYHPESNPSPFPVADALAARLHLAETQEEVDAVAADLGGHWQSLSTGQQQRISAAGTLARARIKTAGKS